MNILFLGDLVGENCVYFLKKNLKYICVKYNINFVITNAENVAEGYGITPDISNNLFEAGVNVISTGNHVWDKIEIIPYIARNYNLFKPNNLNNQSDIIDKHIINLLEKDNILRPVDIIKSLITLRPHQERTLDKLKQFDK